MQARPFTRTIAGSVLSGVELGPPDGPTLVALHGGPGEAHDLLRPYLDALASEHRRVVYYDQRGSGRSRLAPGAPRADATGHVADLAALQEQLSVAHIDLLGFSWGATLAMLYALEHRSRVRRLVLVAPPAFGDEARAQLARNIRDAEARPEVVALRARLAPAATRGEDDGDEARRARFAHRIAPFLARPEVALALTPVAVDTAAARAVDVAPRALEGRLSALRGVPALVVHGRADTIPTASAVALAAHIGASLALLDGCGHAPFAEAPREFRLAVSEFLQD